MVPITRRASSPIFLVQDTSAGKGEGSEEEMTGGYFYCYFYWYFYRSGQIVFQFLALEFHLQNTHAGMGIRNRRTSCAHGY